MTLPEFLVLTGLFFGVLVLLVWWMLEEFDNDMEGY